jgi:3',5'-cyclic AMP phosphodiesterase CpdA
VSLRLHVLSDLHLEQAAFDVPDVAADVLVLAGDIARGTDGIAWAREWADGRPVLYLAGNHEFYGHAAPRLIDELRSAAAGSPVRVLENDEIVVGGVRFLGCTLWSDFDFDGPENREKSMRLCERVVNDYTHISFDSDARTLAAADTRTFHLRSRRWLAECLAQRHDGPTVVVTHHAPLIRTRPPQPWLRAIAGAFASDVTELMGDDRVELWIYGHTHRSADLNIRGTRILSNPRGYPHEPVAGFDPQCVVEVRTAR